MKNESCPKVSIYMPCYNHAEFVKDAIDSVLNQTYTDYEFIIVENGSTDNSFEVISQYDDPRIRLFRLEENNCLKAMEILAQNQKGKYIACIFSDDYWEPTKLEKQMVYLEQHEEVRVCATWAVFVDENMQPISNHMKDIFIQPNRSRLEWIKYLLEHGNCLSACSPVAEAELYKRSFNLVQGYWQLCDFNGWLLALQKTDIYVVEEILVKQRVHRDANSNISFSSNEVTIRTATEYADILLRVIDNMRDEDFIDMYWTELKIQSRDLTHLEVICEKFFILLKFANRDARFQQNIFFYFYKYYSYVEDGVRVSDVMMEKYHFGYQDFTKISGTYGLSKLIKYSKNLLAKLREIVPPEVKEKINLASDELSDCAHILKEDNASADVFYRINKALDMTLDEWDWMEFLEIAIVKEELELCKKVCAVYAQNPQSADCEQICKYLIRYIEAINRITDVSKMWS